MCWSGVLGLVFWSTRRGHSLQTIRWSFRVSQFCGVCPAFVLLFLLLCLLHGLIPLVADNAGSDKRGHVVEWVEKASFAQLNKFFEIDAAERRYETLLTTRNLLVVVRESQVYIINILPRKLPKKVVSGVHYVLKDLPFYKEVKKADAEKR